MNCVLDQLEELIMSVERHDINFIIFSIIAMLFLGAILYLNRCVNENRHDLRVLEKRLIEGYNKLANRLLEQEHADMLDY